jgi:hypothetical protein
MGKCTVCGQEKPLFDVKNKTCGSCAGKKGGRPPIAMVKEPEKKTPANEAPPLEKKAPSGGGSSSGGAEYLCDACDAPVRYGQHKCGKCGTWIDWRGSPVQDDPHLIVCPECGALCGHTDQDIGKCPHCNYGG